jgi:hypothetical protein
VAQHQSVQDTVPESGLHPFWDGRNEWNLLATKMMGNNLTKIDHECAQTQWKRAPSARLLQPERRKIDRKIGSA